MKVLRRTLTLAVCVPGCALLGMMAAADSRFSAWGGAVIGTLLGLFFGLAFGGALPRAASQRETPAIAGVFSFLPLTWVPPTSILRHRL
jgi:hypothetical protein